MTTVPIPIGNWAQTQSKINALKNICREYPAGGGILRELLQNADDAGASTVKFVLDDSSYQTENLLHPTLSQYQGPALLAFNNAIFEDKDFESISRIGDSRKINDGFTTGKFGRGFNSVYNWTDSPSIVSRDRLFILAPLGPTSLDGNTYNFVSDSKTNAMKGHMPAFCKLLHPLDKPLDGTIIRIPLRTRQSSETRFISDRQINVTEMSTVLKDFAAEFSNGGLLFMKHVIKISIESKITGLIELEALEPENIIMLKSKVNNAIISSLKDSSHTFDSSFEITTMTRYHKRGESTQARFMVHHTVQGQAMSKEMADWSRAHKMVPWVAVAVRLPEVIPSQVSLDNASTAIRNSLKGSLFTVMPLHIPVNQPALIHAIFSISPDRARIYESTDSTVQDHLPAGWNKWLFDHPIPHAWTELLCYMVHTFPKYATYDHWPYGAATSNNISSGVLAKVLGLIHTRRLPLWHTKIGHIDAALGLLASGNEPEGLRTALAETNIPLIEVPRRLKRDIENIFRNRHLEPQTLCQYLSDKNDRIKTLTPQAKQTILEYIIAELKPSSHGEILELFPFKDGVYRSIKSHPAFVPRDEPEIKMFQGNAKNNLDIDKFSKKALDLLRRRLSSTGLHPNIRYRSADDLKDYALASVFDGLASGNDIVNLNPVQVSFVTMVWSWMLQNNIDVLNSSISNLWLLPLANGYYRKIKPNKYWIIAPPPRVSMGSIMQRLGEFSNNEPVLAAGKPWLSNSTLARLKTSHVGALLQIHSCENINTLLLWLSNNDKAIEELSDADKYVIIDHISSHLNPGGDSPQDIMKNLLRLRKLPIYPGLVWVGTGDQRSTSTNWVRINHPKIPVGLLGEKVIPLPEFEQFQFIAAASRSIQKILNYAGLAVCMSEVQIVKDFIIPAWQGSLACSWPPSSKEQTATLILRMYSQMPLFSAEVGKRIAALPLVPSQRVNGQPSSKFVRASTLVDPSIKQLTELFFPDEEVLPTNASYKEFSWIYKDFGLRTTVDEEMIYERAAKLASNSYSAIEVRSHAFKLLKMDWSSAAVPIDANRKSFRELQWLPVLLPDGSKALESASRCRGIEDRLRVGFEMPILHCPVSPAWNELFGWNSPLPNDTLIAQINHGIARDDRNVINAVLEYIQKHSQLKSISVEMSRLRCVLANNDTLVTAAKAFYSGCTRLKPYLVNVDRSFRITYGDLLKEIGVRQKPEVRDIINVQAQIEQSGYPLGETDIDVLLETINLASSFPKESVHGLKVLDQYGVLCPIEDIVFNDLPHESFVEKLRFADSRISKQVATKLSIEPLSERVKKGQLQLIDGDDETEFCQQEDIVTSISDTLDRYPIETTFKEFLANADDAEGASKVHWFLDPRSHPTNKLIDDEMKHHQGPALLVYNDGVFSNKDFDGLKDVGRGSKRDDTSTIGQFGRGSQTMYHWSDTPMILSGEFLLILDPLRRSLPKNYRHQSRYSGVKILLSNLRNTSPDQLAPFEDLWGYTLDTSYYNGTIFRMPLRKAPSPLRNDVKSFGVEMADKHLVAYAEEARISLLFLRSIKVVTFKNQMFEENLWSVEKNIFLDGPDLLKSEFVTCLYKTTSPDEVTVAKDEWWVHTEVDQKLESVPVHLRGRLSRVRKNVECGVAALISCTKISGSEEISRPKPKIFCSLPLPIDSHLPVHIHATFALSGDRRSLSTGGEFAENSSSEWNTWLLEDKITKAYLNSLEGLVRHIGPEVYRFWPPGYFGKGELAPLVESFWNTLPSINAPIYPGIQSPGNVSKVMTKSEAVFNLFPPVKSKVLDPFLQNLVPNLATSIPMDLISRFKGMPFQYVGRDRLRSLLKTAEAKRWLQKPSQADVSSLAVHLEILSEIIPINGQDDELDEVVGCGLIPLADGTLADVHILEADTKVRCYYIADDVELDIFSFAKCLMVSQKFRKSESLQNLATQGRFNIKPLKLCDVRHLLSLRPSVSGNHNPETDEWLKKLWSYWNHSRPSVEIPPVAANLFAGQPLLKSTCSGVSLYRSFNELDTLPCVIDPTDAGHKALCKEITGLAIFRPDFMPHSISKAEVSLNDSRSFKRLINALSKLFPEDSSNTTHFVEQLTTSSLRTLQVLAMKFIRSGDQDSHNLLASLQIWPAFNHSTPKLTYLSAAQAKIATDSRLLVPWSVKTTDFVDPRALTELSMSRDCLRQLGAVYVDSEQMIGSVATTNFPTTLTESNKAAYFNFIEAISEHIKNSTASISRLSSIRLAADRNGKMQFARDMFDHNDVIFQAAFGENRSYFLHDGIQKYYRLWKSIGLNHRENSCFESANYIKCLVSLENMIKGVGDTSLVDRNQDIQKKVKLILSPLVEPSSATHRFNSADWRLVAKHEVFLVRRTHSREPDYRRDNMSRISEVDAAIPLSEVILHKYVAVCWSQTPFVILEPTGEVLSKTGRNGEPSTLSVWRHIDHLMQISPKIGKADLEDFISDLFASYSYVQSHLEESVQCFESCRYSLGKNNLWLNIDATDSKDMLIEDFVASWTPLHHLLLISSTDAPPLKCLRQSLMPYEKLLKALGCASVYHPTIEPLQVRSAQSLASALQEMREDGKLLDIVFVSEGVRFPAHKTILAAASTYCSAAFSGFWSNDKEIELSEMTPHTLKILIDTAYELPVDWREMQVGPEDKLKDEIAAANATDKKFDLLLNLFKGADYWGMLALANQTERKILDQFNSFIRFDNLDEFQEKAGNAQNLEKACAAYREKNKVAFAGWKRACEDRDAEQ
ncbi:hypothetical protein ACMFMG_005445 [Clarireedia jacksonii]